MGENRLVLLKEEGVSQRDPGQKRSKRKGIWEGSAGRAQGRQASPAPPGTRASPGDGAPGQKGINPTCIPIR